MERPWLMLRRVLEVGLLHLDDDDDAVVPDVDAEEHPQAAQLKGRVVNVNTNPAASVAAHADDGGGEPARFTVRPVAPPPWLSTLIAGPYCHPDPTKPDTYPYIVATGRFCLLVHFSMLPYYGSHLVVARHFRRTDNDQIAACALPVPDRPDGDLLNNIESVGLVCNQETGHYQIAELIFTTGDPEATVVYVKSDTGAWEGDYHANPLYAVDRRREWVPHGTVTVNSTVCWFDLSWGVISINLGLPIPDQELTYHRLPPGRGLRAGAGDVPLIYSWRCIAVSENLLRYVEIIVYRHQPATVNMWYRDMEEDEVDNQWGWNMNYSERLVDIWDHESYIQTGLRRCRPDLVGVSPVNSNVVYFSLDRRLFGVNVPQRTVVHCEEYEPLRRPGPDNELDTSLWLITWNLDANAAPNVGTLPVPDEPSDHGD